VAWRFVVRAEFRHLFKYIQILREAFEAQDHDRNNRLDLQEVRQALSHAQYPFKDPKTTVKLLQRFDPKERNALVFENFVELAVQLGQTVRIPLPSPLLSSPLLSSPLLSSPLPFSGWVN